MRILDKYMLKAFIGPFLFGIFAFTSIFVGTGTLFRIARYITEYGAGLWPVTKAFVLSLPSIVTLTFPMAVLLASLLAFGKLSGTSEIVVIRAGGLSFLRIATPVYIAAFLISVGAILFNEFVVPHSNHMYQTIIREEIIKQATPPVQEHIVLKSMNGDKLGALMYARKFDHNSKILTGVTVQNFSENGELAQIENADHAVWNGIHWIMKDGVIYDVAATGGVERTLRFSEQQMPITQSPNTIAANKKDLEEMTIKELKEQRQAYKASGSANKLITKLEMEMYNRYAIPIASFIFALVGAPLGLQKQRSSSSIGFGISVIIIFVYYAVMTLTDALGKGGALPTILAASTPDLLGIISGLYLNWRASK